MTKMFLVLLVSFVILMSPYRWYTFVSGLQYAMSSDEATTTGNARLVQKALLLAFSVIYASNSIVNPLLYNILARRFRRKVSNLYCKLKSKFVNNRRPAQFDHRPVLIALNQKTTQSSVYGHKSMSQNTCTANKIQIINGDVVGGVSKSDSL